MAIEMPAKPVADEYGRVSVYAINYYRVCRGQYGGAVAKRCMPTIHNLMWEDAKALAESMEQDPLNSWISVGVDAF